jgi:hypothetical protein
VYFEFAREQSRFLDFSKAGHVPVSVLYHADLLDDKALLLELSSDVRLSSCDIGFTESRTARGRANGERQGNNSKVTSHNIPPKRVIQV